jgi:hypothetical protein
MRARDGTMPFPAFREVVGGKGYRELGEPFDDREHKLFGKEGFESVVRDVAGVRHARSFEVHARMTLTWLVALVGVIGGTMTAIAGARTGSTLVPSSHCASTSSSAATFPHVASALRTVQLRDSIEGQLSLRFAIGEIPKRSARAVSGKHSACRSPRRTSETTPWLPISGRSFRERSSVLSPRNLVQF